MDRRYVGDITYIATWEGWAYLATVIDLASRQVVGWALADHMRTELVEDALTMAFANRGTSSAASSSIRTGAVKADSSGRRNTSMMEVSGDGSQQAAEGDVADAGQDALAGTATGLAARPGTAVLGSRSPRA